MVDIKKITEDGVDYLVATKDGISVRLNLDDYQMPDDEDRAGLKLIQWVNCTILECDEDGVVMHDTTENRQLLVSAVKGAI